MFVGQSGVDVPRLPNMSLGEVTGDAGKATLRAAAHPVRLRIMSLLTGASLTAAEVARELGLTHANASYHLRTLLAAGMIVPAGEERIRGGVAKRYRYDAGHDIVQERGRGRRPDDYYRGLFAGVAGELIRRSQATTYPDEGNLMVDAELWIEPSAWAAFKTRIGEAARELHEAAQAPRTPGTVRTSTSIAMFRMGEDRMGQQQ
jgi:DNA-binding transcriptional ArsR family regulator